MSALIIRLFAMCGISLAPIAALAIGAAAITGAFGVYSLKLYNAGYARAEGKCEAAALQSQVDALQADRDNARSAARDATLKLAAMEQQSQADQERTDAYVKELETNPVPSCALTDDDLRGLRASTRRTGRHRPRPPAATVVHGAGQGPAVKAR